MKGAGRKTKDQKTGTNRREGNKCVQCEGLVEELQCEETEMTCCTNTQFGSSTRPFQSLRTQGSIVFAGMPRSPGAPACLCTAWVCVSQLENSCHIQPSHATQLRPTAAAPHQLPPAIFTRHYVCFLSLIKLSLSSYPDRVGGEVPAETLNAS